MKRTVPLLRRLPMFTGRKLFSVFRHNCLVKALNSLLNIEIKRGESDEVFYADNGVTLQLAQETAVTTTETGSGVVARFKLDGLHGDYVDAFKWDADTGNWEPTVTAVYKPPKLRNSVSSVTIDGITIDYTGYTEVGQTRVATVDAPGGASQDEVIVPRYIEDDILFAAYVDGVWYDLNVDARAWARANTEV